ncbi:MAG: RHS repeat-associated core domain-containing protein, partial [Phycisphaerae bacterium]|nr:RHS repeat-associated core domain-containing protein [Phycisphaerae bacterium]
RYDYRPGSSDWTLSARQRSRYDSGNVRTVKQSLSPDASAGTASERLNLYVYPGDFERAGVRVDRTANGGPSYVGDADLGTETQYQIAGTNVVWKPGTAATGFERKHRITMPLRDMLGTASAVVDLESGHLLEMATFTPNGAREMHWMTDEASLAPERNAFTGKEEDEEVGVTYFGHRYLIARIGRWASPDPLSAHAMGGGEAGNAYHYVAGNVLQSHDANGLWGDVGHYYVVLLAGIASGMDESQAQRIAYFTQFPDEATELDAFDRQADAVSEGAVGPMPRSRFAGLAEANRDASHCGMHALCGGDPQSVRRVARAMAVGAASDWERGASLHLFGDSFAHVKIETRGTRHETLHSPGWGHAPWHTPDHATTDRSYFVGYAGQLFDLMREMNPNSKPLMSRSAFRQFVMRSIALASDDEEARTALVNALQRKFGVSPAVRPEASATASLEEIRSRDAMCRAGCPASVDLVQERSLVASDAIIQQRAAVSAEGGGGARRPDER